ncbi:MAG: hypothetical protein IPK16_01575 [Anaerolineales bacterium]|nr:hypothetical protein [Anaerolineales bacterium]
MSGQPSFPPGFLDQCVDIERIDRAPSFRTISFAGYPWQVKTSAAYPIGPGPNYFSDSTNNVWVDTAGQLHLKLTGSGSYWYAAEVINMASLGYGTYTFTTNGAVDKLDPNVVLGLFTWDTTAPAANYREIDAEFSRWGDPRPPTPNTWSSHTQPLAIGIAFRSVCRAPASNTPSPGVPKGSLSPLLSRTRLLRAPSSRCTRGPTPGHRIRRPVSKTPASTYGCTMGAHPRTANRSRLSSKISSSHP